MLTPLLAAPCCPQVRASGMVVNSMGWIQDLGYELLKHTVEVRGGVGARGGSVGTAWRRHVPVLGEGI